jgi:hypothetical protein
MKEHDATSLAVPSLNLYQNPSPVLEAHPFIRWSLLKETPSSPNGGIHWSKKANKLNKRDSQRITLSDQQEEIEKQSTARYSDEFNEVCEYLRRYYEYYHNAQFLLSVHPDLMQLAEQINAMVRVILVLYPEIKKCRDRCDDDDNEYEYYEKNMHARRRRKEEEYHLQRIRDEKSCKRPDPYWNHYVAEVQSVLSQPPLLYKASYGGPLVSGKWVVPPAIADKKEKEKEKEQKEVPTSHLLPPRNFERFSYDIDFPPIGECSNSKEVLIHCKNRSLCNLCRRSAYLHTSVDEPANTYLLPTVLIKIVIGYYHDPQPLGLDCKEFDQLSYFRELHVTCRIILFYSHPSSVSEENKKKEEKEKNQMLDQFIVDFINDPVLPVESLTEQAGLNYQMPSIHSSMGRQIVTPSMVYAATRTN